MAGSRALKACKKLTRAFVERVAPEEAPYYDKVWDAVYPVLFQYFGVRPEFWNLVGELEESLDSLRFGTLSARLDLLSPQLTHAMYGILRDLAEKDLESVPEEDVVTEVTRVHTDKCRLPRAVGRKLGEFVHAVCQDIAALEAIAADFGACYLVTFYDAQTGHGDELKGLSYSQVLDMQETLEAYPLFVDKPNLRISFAAQNGRDEVQLGIRSIILLAILLQNQGQLCPYGYIERRIWGNEVGTRVPSSRTMIRQGKLDLLKNVAVLSGLIVTETGEGLKFLGGVSFCVVQESLKD